MTSRKIEPSEDSAPERAAQALLNLRSAVDHCHDAIFITDATGKIEFVNPAFEALTGFSVAEAQEGGLGLILESNARAGGNSGIVEPGKDFLDQVLNRGVHRRTLRAVRKNGHRIDLDVAMTVIRDYR